MVSYCQKSDSPGSRIITLADPTIFYYYKTYYLYGTGSGGASNPGSGFVVYTSPDLITWDGPTGENNGLVLKRGDAFGTKGFWAPQVIRHKNLYYLIYSVNDFRNPDYAVGYATSTSPLGPWIKSADSPFISRGNVGENGTGHGDILTIGNRHLLYVFHTHFSKVAVSPRKTAIAEIRFVKDKHGKTDRLVLDITTFRYINCKIY